MNLGETSSPLQGETFKHCKENNFSFVLIIEETLRSEVLESIQKAFSKIKNA